MEMSRLTQDGTVEPVSRDQILRHARGQGNIIFPVKLTTSRIGKLTRLIHTLLYVMTIHTYRREPGRDGRILSDHRQDGNDEVHRLQVTYTPVLSTYPLHTNSGCGKERRILIGPW